MANLLEETLEVLENHGLTIDDIEWIGSEDFKIANFFDIANIRYDDGFGGQEIPYDLVIVGKDWWLERYEYDGSEEWVFKKKPKEPLREKTLKTIPLGAWDSLYELVSIFERKEEQESEKMSDETINGMVETIELLENELEKYKWIPASERLPEEDVAVLISTESGDIRLACRIGGCWRWDYECFETEYFPDNEVLAWQPLPEPY